MDEARDSAATARLATPRPAVPPRWLRLDLLLALGIPFALTVAWLASRLGMWVVLLALAALITFGITVTRSAEGRERRALREHLRSRPPLSVEAQVRRLLEDHGFPPTPEAMKAVADRWVHAARIQRADPRLLRPTDDLHDDYRPVRDPMVKSSNVLDELHDDVEHRLLAEDICMADRVCECGYDLVVLAPGGCCPECGRRVVPPICTFGQFLLFVAGLVPPPSPSPPHARALSHGLDRP